MPERVCSRNRSNGKTVKRQLLIYGDSNTYGYDPSDFFGGPYPDEEVWTYIVAAALGEGWTVMNRGENGRRIPDPASGYEYPKKLLAGLGEEDLFAIMLGANDLLVTTRPEAEVPVRRMDRFLSWLLCRQDLPRILLIAPPYVDTADSPEPLMRRFYEESIRMNEGYRELAAKYDILFADTSSWGVKYAYDHIHLSVEGHRIFAENMIRYLRGIL